MHYNLTGRIAKAHPYQLDKTLSVEGAGAEAKATGEAIEKVSAEVKKVANEAFPPTGGKMSGGLSVPALDIYPKNGVEQAVRFLDEVGDPTMEFIPGEQFKVRQYVNGSRKEYKVLTDKEVVSIAEGGTGAKTAKEALVNLGAASVDTIEDIYNKINLANSKITDLETDLAEEAANTLKGYPVGSVYMSTNSTSPASLFGGTWEQLKDRFLLGAGDTYSNGATDGEATVKLTVDQLPEHTHRLVISSTTNEGSGTTDYVMAGKYTENGTDKGYVTDNPVEIAGGIDAHNNMPPYLVVYMWKRIE